MNGAQEQIAVNGPNLPPEPVLKFMGVEIPESLLSHPTTLLLILLGFVLLYHYTRNKVGKKDA